MNPQHPNRSRWIAGAAVALAAAGLALGLSSHGWATDAPTSPNAEQQAKAAAAAKMDQANAQQLANAPKGTKPNAGAASRACTPAAWDEGVSATQEAPIPAGTIHVTSVWATTTRGHHIAVYAGSVAQDHSKGLLIVQTYTMCGRHVSDTDYPAPAGTGEIQIVSVNQHILALTSSTGASLSFDFDSGTFS
jgi:hypothetical protein